MTSYLKHLEGLSNPETFKRKKDYIDYNFRNYLEKIGLKKLKVLEVGPGLGEFEGYLNDRGVSNIDVIDNDRSILDYIFKRFKINNSFLIKDISISNKKIGDHNFIYLMQVLEHIPTDKYVSCLRVLYSYLEKGGFLIIVVPNANSPLGLTERYSDLQHTGSFTEQSLRDLINVSGIEGYTMEIKGYEIPPYNLLNLLRVLLQKILHLVLLLIMIVNGGLYFKIMTPNITLIIRKT